MSGLTWEDVSGGVGLRVTVPVTMGPDEAARELAPRLSALAGVRATASSGEAGARPGVPVVTIDGYSGSGKSTLAAALARLVNGWQVLHLDDWYPGWDGLFDGVEAWDALSVQLTEGIAGTYTPWDWEAGAPGEVRTVDPAATQVIICEGVGAIAGACEVRILATAPDEVRYERAMARDGDTFRPHWERWAAQEEALLAEIPEDYATVDFIYDSAAQ